MKDAQNILGEILEGIKDSIRLTGWIVASFVDVISSFVNHRDHKHS